MDKYKPKFKGDDTAFGVLGRSIVAVKIKEVFGAEDATDPIHITNSDDAGRNWHDGQLFSTPEAAARNIVDSWYANNPAATRPEGDSTSGASEELLSLRKNIEEAEALDKSKSEDLLSLGKELVTANNALNDKVTELGMSEEDNTAMKEVIKDRDKEIAELKLQIETLQAQIDKAPNPEA